METQTMTYHSPPKAPTSHRQAPTSHPYAPPGRGIATLSERVAGARILISSMMCRKPKPNPHGVMTMTTTVLLTDGTVGTLTGPTPAVGDHVTVRLHDEDGRPLEVAGVVETVLEDDT